MSAPKPYAATDAVILAGGVEVPVVRRVGKKLVRERGFVRLIEVAEYPALFRAITPEPALCEFICAQPPGWGATLTPDSLNEVCDAALDINFQSACRWAARQAKTSEASREMQGAVTKVLGQLSSLFASTPVGASAALRGK